MIEVSIQEFYKITNGRKNTLIGQVKTVVASVRQQHPEGELKVMMYPVEYRRLEDRVEGGLVDGFELVGDPSSDPGHLTGWIVADHVWHPELQARFYPDFTA